MALGFFLSGRRLYRPEPCRRTAGRTDHDPHRRLSRRLARRLNHWWKLAGEVAAALMIVHWSGINLFTFGDILSFGSIDFHDYSVFVTVFCVVGIANAFNMMDGMDGLAGGVSLAAFLSFACISRPERSSRPPCCYECRHERRHHRLPPVQLASGSGSSWVIQAVSFSGLRQPSYPSPSRRSTQSVVRPVVPPAYPRRARPPTH
ncbi:MAG: hypothetical protein MZV70_66100 [Desulfobacterales bacterium]|nr:hypothetical protein [Desulfobacterales bacterium]